MVCGCAGQRVSFAVLSEVWVSRAWPLGHEAPVAFPCRVTLSGCPRRHLQRFAAIEGMPNVHSTTRAPTCHSESSRKNTYTKCNVWYKLEGSNCVEAFLVIRDLYDWSFLR